jgi:hypothetical protein
LERIPQRHVEHAHSDGTLAMAAGLLVLHHRRPAFRRVEQPARVDEIIRLGVFQPRDEPLAQQPLRRIAAVRIEAEADHRFSVAHRVGEDRDHARGHRRKIDVGVGDLGRDRNDDVGDTGDAHARASE